MVDLQYYISFWCTAQFIKIICGYCKIFAVFPMLYYIFLYYIYFIHRSLSLLIPYPKLPLLTLPSLLVTTSLFSISVSLFFFCYIHQFYFSDSTYK